MADSHSDLASKLALRGQSHLLDFWGNLTASERQSLAQQIESIDLEQLQSLFMTKETKTDWGGLANRAVPPPAVSTSSLEKAERTRARRLGEGAIRGGKLGAILVAGGQGTRLGFDKPKGMFRLGPLSHRSLFEMHVDRLRGVMRRYGASIPLFIMTSPATDRDTREFFEANHRFGLREDELFIFCQGMMPAVDATNGKVLLSGPGEIAMSPDGHGGMLQAMAREGCLHAASQLGIEHFFYAQVDNPLVPLCDPELVGYHLDTESQLTTQVVRKRFAKEKVGNVVSIDGRIMIIEYSDLPDDVAERKNPDGSLALWAGNIAVHLFQRSFLERVQSEAKLPFHYAHKAVPWVDIDGTLQNPSQPNAIKFEKFIFDLLPLAERSIVVESDASEVFAPVKNANGAPNDTPESAQKSLVALHRRWLMEAGAKVGDGVTIEINPRWALDAEEVREKIQSGCTIDTDTYFVG